MKISSACEELNTVSDEVYNLTVLEMPDSLLYGPLHVHHKTFCKADITARPIFQWENCDRI